MSMYEPPSREDFEAGVEEARKRINSAELKRLQAMTVSERFDDHDRRLDQHERAMKEQELRDEVRLQELYQKMRKSLQDDEQVDDPEMVDDFDEKWRETPE